MGEEKLRGTPTLVETETDPETVSVSCRHHFEHALHSTPKIEPTTLDQIPISTAYKKECTAKARYFDHDRLTTATGTAAPGLEEPQTCPNDDISNLAQQLEAARNEIRALWEERKFLDAIEKITNWAKEAAVNSTHLNLRGKERRVEIYLLDPQYGTDRAWIHSLSQILTSLNDLQRQKLFDDFLQETIADEESGSNSDQHLGKRKRNETQHTKTQQDETKSKKHKISEPQEDLEPPTKKTKV